MNSYKTPSLVSCFLPVRNASMHLLRWWEKNSAELKSVDADLIVVDNGSDDNSLEIVRSFDYSRTTIVEHKDDRGLEQSFCSGKSRIKSKYRFFLPADDWLAPGYLLSAVQALETYPTVSVVYGRSYIVDLATGKVFRRVNPVRKTGLIHEYFLTPLFFNNFIPDISLYRSAALDLSWNTGSWFPPGGLCEVLANGDVYYTDQDHCFSGKSAGQVSRAWSESGQYYRHLMRNRMDAASLCYDFVDWLVWYLGTAHFHSKKPLLDLLREIQSGHNYVRTAFAKSAQDVFYRLALLLIDDLCLDADGTRIKKTGELGTLEHLRALVKLLTVDQTIAFREQLAARGLSSILQ